uniref:SLC26A/SulP transporter domain-containing protein n=1 Tax=Chrysotila carterae TaxID=13221 RepID=A0A7S4B933_CHRCT
MDAIVHAQFSTESDAQRGGATQNGNRNALRLGRLRPSRRGNKRVANFSCDLEPVSESPEHRIATCEEDDSTELASQEMIAMQESQALINNAHLTAELSLQFKDAWTARNNSMHPLNFCDPSSAREDASADPDDELYDLDLKQSLPLSAACRQHMRWAGTIAARLASVACPCAKWLRLTTSGTIRADFIAGLTVAMMLVPQSMSYAAIAGLPYSYGLYASVVPLATYSILGSSRQLQVGPVAMVSLLVQVGLHDQLTPEDCPGSSDAASALKMCPEVRFESMRHPFCSPRPASCAQNRLMRNVLSFK